ncbi:winged helix-turn-helix domain-containing protein [Streptomyces sp. NPDC052042]|uniref:AfsR/SARP family transcriptional regulator n=1 Tax=Streptomyces sp. NPDC052042 TaxID=3365683 RepID=UPI0037D91931
MNQLVFKMLGPLEVQANGVPLRIRGRRQTIVLAVLLLSADRTVSVDTLVDAVWPDSPPATARNQIAICVATLRKTFKEAGENRLLLTKPPGYRPPIAVVAPARASPQVRPRASPSAPPAM